MNKQLEDHLPKHQADMISIALEYVDNKADEVFVHAASEEGTSSFDVFYKINGKIVRKEEINSAVNPGKTKYDDTEERQDAMLDIGLDNIEAIEEKCLEFGVKTPTEMRLHYDVKSGRFRAKLRYDNVFTDTPDLLPGNVFDAWYSSELRGESSLGPA
ncbi:DUF600 domain-containing protein [Pseudomonas juntendi]|uniref:DUF600 domain-containing protein n=2 Tax=Pseudomonas juntendi TaxID=2666183 RepID=A0A7W2LYV4_9PSED|nr:DUF600 domain-containing protein [Pseudomonas juntendi]MBA6134221.1 DUF600 domain-containing protein [Pseudomonas juntendi]MBA6149587.1 DUF600 domain-containing protein [Pseudomonas juntendi]MDG9809833.1 hypothetical protein [Pseudomonas juntendi]